MGPSESRRGSGSSRCGASAAAPSWPVFAGQLGLFLSFQARNLASGLEADLKISY